MRIDSLKRYLELQSALRTEKIKLENRLAQINKALAGQTVAVLTEAAPAPAPAKRGGRRIQNKLTLKEAITKATASKPLTKPEILDAVKRLGYRFQTKDPMNTLSVVLYTKRQFKNQNGRFGPTKA